MTDPIYIARVKSPRKTAYSVGKVLYQTAAPSPDEARQLAALVFDCLPKDATPVVEVVQLFDNIPNSDGQVASLSRPLYTVKEAAALMGTSVTTVNRWLASGDMPYIQVGYNQARRIARQDIEAWIERNRRKAI